MAASRDVVIVDDDPAILRIFSLVLMDVGYEVYSALNAETALESLADVKPGVIVCDVQLPGMSGTELTKQLRSLPEYDRTPIILFSAYGEPRGHEADAFCEKPIDPFEFAETVRGWLESGRRGNRRLASSTPATRMS